MNKQTLINLYYTEGKTLQQIGRIYGFTREYIRQVMEKFDLPRNTKRARPIGFRDKRKVLSLKDYFLAIKNGRRETSYILRRLLKSRMNYCSICNSTKRIGPHHLRYPATSMQDIQILCRSCHRAKHEKGIDVTKQVEIYNAHSAGVGLQKLVQKYKVTDGRICQILMKVRANPDMLSLSKYATR